MNKFQQGLTLIELMISITLGLLIVAAGLSIYLSGQRSLSLQHGMSELQQNALFGLSVLTHDLRHTNLDTNSSHNVNNKIVGSGIIFDTANLPSSLKNVDEKYFTKQNVNSAGTTQESDQLTIQFMPQYSTDIIVDIDKDGKETGKQTTVSTSKMIDCEGRVIDFSVNAENSTPSTVKPIYVQRYYVSEIKKDNKSYTPKKFALYCDAGYYNPTDTQIEGLGTNGQQIMQNVDAFKVKLGVKSTANTLRYMTIDDYKKLNNSVTDATQYNQIVSIEIGVLAKSSNPIGANADIDNTQPFSLFGESSSNGYGIVTLAKEQQSNSKYLRQAFSQVVAIRNTLGASE